jgi:hypothetical protein
VKALNEHLEKIGYGLELETVDWMKNKYDVKITKNGKTFSLGSASSGE